MSDIETKTDHHNNNRVTALHRDAPVICSQCGRSAPRKARQQKFCSARCREKARERSRKAFLGQATGAPTNPLKKANGFNVLPAWKSGSSIAPRVPREIIEIEVFGGRAWREVTSSDGVVCEASTLRPRTLRNGGAS
jgi:hypothetical protein